MIAWAVAFGTKVSNLVCEIGLDEKDSRSCKELRAGATQDLRALLDQPLKILWH